MGLKIVRYDILDMNVDAIVNPTDMSLSGAGSIDKRIHEICGQELEDELSEFDACKPGDAILTNAYNLLSNYIIHVVGNNWDKSQNAYEILKSCYENALSLAERFNIQSVAFPLISTGTFECPINKAIQIGISVINKFCKHNSVDVYLVVYSSEAFGLSKELLEKIEFNFAIKDTDNEELKQALSFYKGENDYTLEHVGNIYASKKIKETLESNIHDEISNYISDIGLKKIVNEHKSDIAETFCTKLFKIIDRFDYKDSEIYNSAGISRMVFSNIRKGIIPKKKTIFQLCIALPIGIDESIELLSSAGYTFMLSDEYERVIKKIIECKDKSTLTRVDVVDLILYDLNLPLFIG